MPGVRFRRLAQIDQGAQGAVFEGVREDNNEPVALKFLPDGATEAQRLRFQREVRLQSSLRHPNILAVLSYNLEEGARCFFAMPLAKGNLRTKLVALRNNKPLAFSFFEQILAAVEYSHQNGVIHRDLKPENILLMDGPEGEYLAISDFGAGRFTERDSTPLTGTVASIGTRGYAAPEQFGEARDADEHCDIYALGVILLELLTDNLTSLPSAMASLPNGLGYIVEKCIQPRPEDRYASVAQLRRDFDMFTTRTELLEPPEQRMRTTIERLAGHSIISRDDVIEIDRIFQENQNNEELLKRVFPSLPDPILHAYTQLLPTPFKGILIAYDNVVSGGLPWEYCDVVARFYNKLFNEFADTATRKLILARLLEMGVGHNRFFVMEMIVTMIASLREPADVATARDVLEEHEHECRKLKASLLAQVRLPLLRQVIEEVSARPDPWDISF